MADAVLAIEPWCATFEMLLERRLEARRIVGVHDNVAHPIGARADLGFRALTVQHFHPGRKKQAVGRYVPVPIALVGSFHRERIALLALTQRPLAGCHASYLAQQRCEGERAEQGDCESADNDSNRLIAPRLQRDCYIAGHGERQVSGPDGRDRDEHRPPVDRIYEIPRYWGGGQGREDLPDRVSNGGIAHQQSPVIAHQLNRAPPHRCSRLDRSD